MNTDVAVVDFGVGNLFSVTRALDQEGAKVSVVSGPENLGSASRVVVPGVGAFRNCMKAMTSSGMAEAIVDYAKTGKPLFGVCLGMQILFESSTEHELTEGLGLIPGRVLPIPNTTTDGEMLKVPHIGWNDLRPGEKVESWQQSILRSTAKGSPVYFVHSFMAVPENPADRLADCIYGNHRVSAIVAKDNVVGAQFHPEKSGNIGLGMLREFLRL